MLAPMEPRGWDGFRPLPTDVYLNLVRFFYYNLEVGNLGTLNSRVRGKDIILNLIILSRDHGDPHARDCIFISKPIYPDKYVNKKHKNEVIAKNGAIGVTEIK